MTLPASMPWRSSSNPETTELALAQARGGDTGGAGQTEHRDREATAMGQGAGKALMQLILAKEKPIEVQHLYQILHRLIGNDPINRPQQRQAAQALAIAVLHLYLLAEARVELESDNQIVAAEAGSPQEGHMAMVK